MAKTRDVNLKLFAFPLRYVNLYLECEGGKQNICLSSVINMCIPGVSSTVLCVFCLDEVYHPFVYENIKKQVHYFGLKSTQFVTECATESYSLGRIYMLLYINNRITPYNVQYMS